MNKYCNALFAFILVDILQCFSIHSINDNPRYLGSENSPLLIYQADEFGFINEAFVVHIPAVLEYFTEEIRVIVDAYKLTGRTFTIVIF